MVASVKGRIRVGPLEELEERGCTVVTGGGHAIAVFHHEGQVYAVDNRCPHMGFPLDRGQCQGRDPDLPLASRAIRPLQRRDFQPLCGRRAKFPGQRG